MRFENKLEDVSCKHVINIKRDSQIEQNEDNMGKTLSVKRSKERFTEKAGDWIVR